jgi:hypothetical protein
MGTLEEWYAFFNLPLKRFLHFQYFTIQTFTIVWKPDFLPSDIL